MPPEITLSFPFSYSQRILAALALIPQRKFTFALHSVLPLIGILSLGFVLSMDRSLSPSFLLAVVLLVFFTPLITLCNVTLSYLFNPAVREPFSYKFDAAGVHASAVTYEYTHKWAAISKVKSSFGFLMFFFSPGCAHCIPMKEVQDSGNFNELIELVKSQGIEVSASEI